MVYCSFLYYLLVYVPYFCCWGNMYDLLNPPAHWRSLQIRKPNNLRSDSPRYRTPAPSNILALSFSNITNTHLPFCTQPTKKTLPAITNKHFVCFSAPQLFLLTVMQRLKPSAKLEPHHSCSTQLPMQASIDLQYS